MAEQECRKRLHYAPSSAVSLLTAVAAMAVLLPLCTRAEDLDCQYKYTKQLPHNPSCEPYTMGIMKIECIAEVPRNASDVSIGWLLDCVELTNDSHVEISVQVQDSEMTGIRNITSRLTISPITDEYAGGYTCNLLGDEEYIPSDILTLHDSKKYEIFMPLGPCDDSGDVFAHAEPAPQKCADITVNRTIPMSLSCAEPPATTSHDTPMTSTPVVYTSATTSHDTPMTSTPVVYTSASPTSSLTPSPSSLTPSPSSVPHIVTTPTPSPTASPKQDPPSSTSDSTSTWFYVVVTVAVVFFMIIVVLAIVCSGMCIRQKQIVTVDEQTLKQPVQGNKLTSNAMRDNAAYQGDVVSTVPDPALPNTPHNSDVYDYRTLGNGDYEDVNMPDGDYQRLQRPSLTPGMMMPRLVTSSEATFSPTATMASMYPLTATLNGVTKINTGIVPPPLPSTARPGGNMGRFPNSLESSDSAFNTGSAEVFSPVERDRINSSSRLLSHGSATDFEALYVPRDQQRTSPSPPRLNHPLQRIPETGASFPEPRNPNPFPTSAYEGKRGEDTGSKHNLTQYGRSIHIPDKTGHPHTFPVHSPSLSPPPSGEGSRATVHALNNQAQLRDTRDVTDNPSHFQQLEFGYKSAGPIYHSLEEPNSIHVGHNGSATELKDVSPSVPEFPVFETADFTDYSGTNSLTPGFPVCSADFADEFTSGNSKVPQTKRQPQQHVSNDYSPDFTGDSDYPLADDCTGGSSSTAYPESDWTAGTSAGDREASTGNSAIFTRTPTTHTSGSTLSSGHLPTTSTSNGLLPSVASHPRVSAGSSHTVPLSGSSAIADMGGATSHTISTSRNHYKKLDPSTMEPLLKYTRLNVGKLTVV